MNQVLPVRLVLHWFAFAALAFASGPLTPRPASSAARSESGNEPSSALVRSSVNWVRVPVHVTDQAGANVTGLGAPDFRLLEDGVEQQIRRVAIEEAPASIAIVFDASSSMNGKLDQSRIALRKLFDHALPGDEYALIEFGNEPHLVNPFTTDADEVQAAADRIRLSTWTALHDALYLGIAQARRAANPRKAILLLSDGADNNSRYSARELRRYLQESDVAIYSIAIGSSYRHATLLRGLSEATGGLSIDVKNVNELAPAVARISHLLRSQYVLDYVSNQTSRVRDGLYRRVEVKLVSPGSLRLHWRRGYFEPASF